MLRQALFLGGLSLIAFGCTNYYRVSDPTTGKTYYTRLITERMGGGATFTDARTGSDITLQNYEVQHISRDQYDLAKEAKATTVVVPTAVPAGATITPVPGDRDVDVHVRPTPSTPPADSDVRIHVE